MSNAGMQRTSAFSIKQSESTPTGHGQASPGVVHAASRAPVRCTATTKPADDAGATEQGGCVPGRRLSFTTALGDSFSTTGFSDEESTELDVGKDESVAASSDDDGGAAAGTAGGRGPVRAAPVRH